MEYIFSSKRQILIDCSQYLMQNYQLSSYLLTGFDYESLLSPPSLFTNPRPPSSQDMEPDGPQYSILHLLSSQGSQAISSSEEQKINCNSIETSPHQEEGELIDYIFKDEKLGSTLCYPSEEKMEEQKEEIFQIVRIGEPAPQPPDEPEELSSPPEAQMVKAQRKDDSNNACKKFNTFLWKHCLTANDRHKLQRELTRFNKVRPIDPKKGSKYCFPCYLINIRLILGEEKLLEVYQRFTKQDILELLSCKNEESTEYLKSMIPHYQMAFRYMIEDEIIMSVEAIYKSKEFRQITYKQKGIKYVTEYHEKIQNIIYELNMRKQ